MAWSKNISNKAIGSIAAGLVIIAIALGYIAAGKKAGINSDTQVHVRDVAPASEAGDNPTEQDASNQNGQDQICAQVVTRARNPHTDQVQEFPTPCDVPASWELVP